MEFGILGPLAVWEDGREVELGAAKQRALLAALLLHAGETMATERLVDALWGEKPPATAVKALQVYVSQLRKVLGDGVVETRPLGYVLRVEEGALDLQRFEELLAEGRRLLADGASQEGAEVLRQALALWRGPALADVPYESFARDEIGRLEELRLVALGLRVEADLALDRAAEVVPELEALVREHPLRERLRGLLMLALYRAGRQADALTVMQETRAVLRDELGLDPSQALQQLEKAILDQDPALDGAAPLPGVPEMSAPPAAEPSPETRKTVTVLSYELTVDAATDGELDPEGLSGVTSPFAELAAEVIARHGGTVDRFVGGEGIAVFGVPVVREDDALRAARTAVDLRDQLAAQETGLGAGVRLELRVALATGEVVTGDAATGERLVTGSVLSVARRLQQSAGAGELLLAEGTYALVRHAVSASPLRLADPRRELTAVRLESVDPEGTALPRRDDIPLVGRGRQLARLRAEFAELAGGAGARHFTIVGEAGIGKSRLARELLAAVTGEATVLVGRCPPYGEGVTFWPLRELLRQAGRDESVLGGPMHEVFASVRHLLEELAVDRPVIAVFDDVHWAEPTFLDLIEDLAARLGPARVLLLCLARPQLADVRPAWLHEPALALEPLSRAESKTLVAALGAPASVRATIAESAEGNPLFVEQLAAMADESGAGRPMPTSIRGVLHERLDRLAREERALLERAAVAGRSFTLDAVLELTPPEERDGVQPGAFALVRKKLLRPDTTSPGAGFRFHHALVRDATYEGIPKRARADLHERMAARLETLAAEDALVGYHLEQAFLFRRELGADDQALAARAAQLLASAGRDAFERSDASASISLLGRALALLPRDDPGQPRLLTDLAGARLLAGDRAGAEADLDEAIETASNAGDRAVELHAVIQRAFTHHLAGGREAEDCAKLAREAMPELERFGDELGLAKAWQLTGLGYTFTCRFGRMAEALEEALVHARRVEGGRWIRGTLSANLALVLLIGPTPAREAISRVRALALEVQADRLSLALVNVYLAGLLATQGALEDARRLYAEVIEACAEFGLDGYRASLRSEGAQIELLAGDPVAAEQELRDAADELGRLGLPGLAQTRLAMRADILCTLGRLDEAETLVREVAEASFEYDVDPQVRWRSTLGRVLARRDELEDAEQLVSEAVRLSDAIECPELRFTALTAAAEVAEAQQRRADATRLLEEAREIMEAKGNIVVLRSIEARLTEAKPAAASNTKRS